ncbi:MAG: HypC/HybG/HupF family hydrogenase formation chaperone [Alphaproteobacteria bacterium]|nr:HypC/HybG/HupF family hydrogenase formation chaperone [Alphaproteobacteria bacterium]
MCLGVPVQVIEDRGFMALCRGRGGEVEVNMMLVGPQEPGTWLVNFLGTAREVMTEDDAQKANSALDALEAVLNGEDNVDRFFPDLTGHAT